MQHLPVVDVNVYLKPNKNENFFVKDLSFAIEDGEIQYGLKYEYKPTKIEEIYKMVQCILSKEDIDRNTIAKIKMNLLPIEYYAYSISVPGKESVSYDVLKMYKYIALEAERDDFSRTRERIGSKSLVKLFQMGLTNADKIKVEKNIIIFLKN